MNNPHESRIANIGKSMEQYLVVQPTFLMTWPKIHLHQTKKQTKQDCIPVGCVPPAR